MHTCQGHDGKHLPSAGRILMLSKMHYITSSRHAVSSLRLKAAAAAASQVWHATGLHPDVLGHCLHLQEFGAALDALHKQYFDAVEALFHKHMPTFPGYEDLSLVMLR